MKATMSEAGLRLYGELATASDRPQLIASAVASHRIPSDDLPELFWFAWVYSDEPTLTLSEAVWTSIFKTAGFFSWPSARARPLTPMTVYRGAMVDRPQPMSWTVVVNSTQLTDIALVEHQTRPRPHPLPTDAHQRPITATS
jgi:hypothetical protein